MAIQLRFLQTLMEIGWERNSTTIFPVPIDLFTPFIEAARPREGEPATARDRAARVLSSGSTRLRV